MDLNLTTIIVIITGIVSYLSFNNRNLFDQLKHYPYVESRNKEYYRWLSSGFVHGSGIHLFVNLFVLYQFGGYIEKIYVNQHGIVLGKVLFLVTYLTTIVLADIPSYYKHKNNPSYASIGASGGVSGIVFIFCMLLPWNILELYFVLPIPAIVFAVLYLWYSSWASKNQNDRIDHSAHFYGAVAGVLLYFIFIPGAIKTFLTRIVDDFPL